MPAIAPAYLYTFFALVTVSSILIASFSAFASTLRAIPEMEQLENLIATVASKGYELIALTMRTHSTSEAVLKLPSSIGDKDYWIELRTESSRTWVAGALGSIHSNTSRNRVYFPQEVSATGNYSSSYGPVLLTCSMDGSTVSLRLDTWR